jgi:lariat debranching enzyme
LVRRARQRELWCQVAHDILGDFASVFAGGNHEASNHLRELFFGGWVAPNIYYLGAAGVVNFGGLRIAGFSGIWGERDHAMGYYEQPPYSPSDKISVYHVREFDVFRLLQVRFRRAHALLLCFSFRRRFSGLFTAGVSVYVQVSQPIDIFMSHDWPRNVTRFGDEPQLLRCKPAFRNEVLSTATS